MQWAVCGKKKKKREYNLKLIVIFDETMSKLSKYANSSQNSNNKCTFDAPYCGVADRYCRLKLSSAQNARELIISFVLPLAISRKQIHD